jgi:MFS family permease
LQGFLFIWLSSTVSLFGDWFNYVATLDVIYESTDAAMALSLYLTARMVPPFIISPIVGPIADHFDRRKLMVFDIFVFVSAVYKTKFKSIKKHLVPRKTRF